MITRPWTSTLNALILAITARLTLGALQTVFDVEDTFRTSLSVLLFYSLLGVIASWQSAKVFRLPPLVTMKNFSGPCYLEGTISVKPNDTRFYIDEHTAVSHITTTVVYKKEGQVFSDSLDTETNEALRILVNERVDISSFYKDYKPMLLKSKSRPPCEKDMDKWTLTSDVEVIEYIMSYYGWYLSTEINTFIGTYENDKFTPFSHQAFPGRYKTLTSIKENILREVVLFNIVYSFFSYIFIYGIRLQDGEKAT